MKVPRATFSEIWEKYKPLIELVIILFLSVGVFFFSSQHNLLEVFFNFSRAHEDWQLDELSAVGHFLVVSFFIFSFRRWMEVRRVRNELLIKNEQLEKSLSEIKTLQGIIPICSSCKKIRDDKGYWTQVEEYIHAHTDAAFTHGVCPDCQKKILENYQKNKELSPLKVS